MKKTIFLLVSMLGLGACASFQQQQVDWRGQNFDRYVLSKGTPTSQYTSQSGATIYSFKKSCEYAPMKTGETLVIVGADNLIQDISTPTKCPTYYETPQYQHQQEMARKEKKDKEQIKLLEGALKGVNTMISSQQTTVKSTESDLDLTRRGILRSQSVQEYEKKLNS